MDAHGLFPHSMVLTGSGGEITIRAFCTSEDIQRYSYDSQFGAHARYRSLYTKKASLESIAARKDTRVALALVAQTHIVGIGVLTPPEPDERWAELGPGLMMEVKALEVARDWRSSGIAGGLLRMLLTHPQAEDMIIYMVGYSWTWDLDATGKSAHEYRQTLIQLFEPYGFQEFQSNEPNICLKPENLFMARIGPNVSREIQHRFKWLCFGASP